MQTTSAVGEFAIRGSLFRTSLEHSRIQTEVSGVCVYRLHTGWSWGGGGWTKPISLHLSKGISITSRLQDVFDGFCNDCVFSKCENHTHPPFPPAFPINPRFRPDTLAHRTTFLCFCLRICRMQTFLILSLSMISLFQL